MDTKIIFLYCLADAISKALKMREDPHSKMTQAEIITFVMISALFYQGNYQMTHQVTQSCRYFSKLLSHSRLIRRIHQIDESVWLKIFAICRDFIKTEQCTDYIVDSYPVAVCENYKRFRCKLFPGKKFHRYTASKKQYFFGIKVHMLVNSEGVPIEFVFSPGGESDIRGAHISHQHLGKPFASVWPSWPTSISRKGLRTFPSKFCGQSNQADCTFFLQGV